MLFRYILRLITAKKFYEENIMTINVIYLICYRLCPFHTRALFIVLKNDIDDQIVLLVTVNEIEW
jgi:hypothetical protein